VLGYGKGLGAGQSRPNTDFHMLYAHFVNQVTLFWRDKRISDVIRERAIDPSFGSIAVVRRAGLDLRNNLKFTSFGHLNVLRVEVMQVLEECFRILDADDVKKLFGADNAWDVVDEVLIRYFDERLQSSPRQRMAVTGRDVLRWLAGPHIMETTRGQFEALLMEIAEPAEEWLTSAQAMSLARRTGSDRVLPWEQMGVRLEKWVRGRAKALGAPKLDAVYLVSVHKDLSVRNLIAYVKELAGPRSNVWVIGAQNAGKSTLINAFAKKQGVKITRLTEAAVPGTTLGILRMTGVLPAKAKVYDTPGLLHPYIMSMRLNSEERKMVEIRKELRPRTFRVKVNLKSVVNIVLVLFISHGVAETYLVLQ
jgi:hypothetical protein